MNFIDIGGHIGTTTINVLTKFKNAHAVIFEPNKDNLVMLKNNLILNKLNKRTTVIDKAITGSKNSKIKLYNRHDSANFSSIIKTTSYSDVDNFYFGNLEKYLGKKGNLLKIDIEGGEYEFFTDMFVSLLKRFDIIILEYHNVDKKRNLQYLTNFLEMNHFPFQLFKNIFSIRWRFCNLKKWR